MKQHFITITYNGVRHSFLVGAYQENGIWKISQELLNALLDKVRVLRGTTYSIG